MAPNAHGSSAGETTIGYPVLNAPVLRHGVLFFDSAPYCTFSYTVITVIALRSIL